jgi:hypothetical protein
MPVTLAPSSVFPTLAAPPPLSTTSASAYVDWNAVGKTAAARPYRGVIAVEPAGVVATNPVLGQLEALGARLEAMRPKAAAVATQTTSSASAEWESSTYDTFAQFASEASRVRPTGRLPFGSDSKKMSL